MSDKIKLVLMSCCAPCSCGAIKQIANGEKFVMPENPFDRIELKDEN